LCVRAGTDADCKPVIGGDVTGQWTVDQIVGTPVLAGTTVSLDFQNGKLSGSGTCNRFNASYTNENGHLTIGSVVSTRMACEPTSMQQEQRFFQALSRVTAQRVAGTRLEMLADDQTTVVIAAHR
jgi:heat shock protein HslJ